MASISSVGIGSGVLTSDLIDKFIEADRAPTELRLKRQEEEVTAKLSAFGKLQSAITELRLPARTLGNPAALSELTLSSTNDAVSGSVGSKAKPGQYSVEVLALAQSHSLATGVIADKDSTTLGTGIMTITSGNASVNITIDNSNNTLEGIANAINGESALGVNASVIDTGSGFQLVLSSQKSGTENAIEITVDDDDLDDSDGLGLSQFAYNATDKKLTETIQAEDASIKVNGVTIARATNTIDDVVEGVTFNISETNIGSPAIVNVAQDGEVVAERVQEFVDKFNELQALVTELTEFNETNSEDSGLLLGDSTVRNVINQTKNIIGRIVPGLENASVRSLSEVGITTDKETGQFNFDKSIFIGALEESSEDVIALFSEQGRVTDPQINFVSSGINTKAGTYDVEVTQLATRGELTGTVDVSAGLTIDANNDNFTIKINGVESASIALTNKAYTSAELVAELQSKINDDINLKAAGESVIVGLDGSNQLTFTSATYGSGSTVEFSAVDTNTLSNLGIDAIAGTEGVDVTGKINGVEATGVGRQLRANTGDSNGVLIEITGGSVGSRGSVTFITGISDQLVDLFNGFLGAEGTVTTRIDGLNEQLVNISTDRTNLNDRLSSLRERLAMQFTAADILVSQLNSTQDFLKAQLAALSQSK